MTPISTVEARKRFAEVLNRVAHDKERVILTRRGKELVAVVPIEEVRFLGELEQRLDLRRPSPKRWRPCRGRRSRRI